MTRTVLFTWRRDLEAARKFVWLAGFVSALAVTVGYAGEVQDQLEVNPEDHAVCGSLDGDSKVNLADAVYLLNYIFQGGAAPICSSREEPVLNEDSTPCENFSSHRLEACQLEAQAQFWTARATCATSSDAEERDECIAEASAEFEEEQLLCQARLEARLAVCSDPEVTYPEAGVDPSRFVDGIDNPYFGVAVGLTLVYESQTDEGSERDSVWMTNETRDIQGVRCRIVREVETVDGQVVETSDEWFAQDDEGNVWCFGERSLEFEGGRLTEVDSWEAGADGARAAVCMPAAPATGQKYFQEFAPGTSEEVAEVLSHDEAVTIRSGSFLQCVKIAETDLLEPGTPEQKYFAPGIGRILQIDPENGERAELVEIIRQSSTSADR